MNEFEFELPVRVYDRDENFDYAVRPSVKYYRCGANKHPHFSVTGTIYRRRNAASAWRDEGGGCVHSEIAMAYPELAPFIKWHLVAADGPMHYAANGAYRVFKSEFYEHEDPDPKALDHFKSTVIWGAAPSFDHPWSLDTLMIVPRVAPPDGVIWEKYAESAEGKDEAGAELERRVKEFLDRRAGSVMAAFEVDLKKVLNVCIDLRGGDNA